MIILKIIFFDSYLVAHKLILKFFYNFFQTEILLKVRLMGEHQVIAGSIKDLSILTGIYNPDKRTDSIYEVIESTLLVIK